MKTGRGQIKLVRIGLCFGISLVLLVLAVGEAQAQFTFVTNNGALTITGYTGPGGAVDIPSATNGLPVTSIGPYAFVNKSNLKNVLIPDSVTNIGHSAFRSCTGLTNVMIGNSVTTLGSFLFEYCTSLTNATIPNSVTSIGGSAFYGCTNLIAIKVDALNSVYSSVDGVLFDLNQSLLIECPAGKVGTYMIPSSVTNIGSAAFSSCARLTSITISDSVSSIGDYAFEYCTGLTNVMVGNSVTTIGDLAFFSCTSLTSISIPNSVTVLGNFLFDYCTSLNTITVDALNAAYSSLEGVLFNKSQTMLLEYPAGKAGSYSVPNGVTNIGIAAFEFSAGLNGVAIPDSVSSIGNAAFAYCHSLASVTIGNSVTTIGDQAFLNDTNLTAVNIPNSVTTIGGAAFSGCTSLTNVTIGNSVTTIGGSAFYGCTGLNNVTIGNSVTNIGTGAFTSCTNLIGVYFRGNAPSLGSVYVFNGDNNATIYFLPGTTGWTPTFGGRPTALWRPQVQTGDDSFGVRTNQFGFNLSWASGMDVAVDACTDLSNPVWTPLQTNTLTADTLYFSDPQWTNHPARFYRLRWP